MSDTKVKAKGTTKTEAIIGAASNKFVTAKNALQDAVTQALKLTETMDEQALKIADSEEKLNNLEMDYSNKKTQQTIELGLAYKADERKFAHEYLTSNHLVAVNDEEYMTLRNSVTEWEQKFADKVNAEVGKANGIANGKIENEKKLTEAQYQAKEAGNLAQIQNLQSQLASVKEWNMTLQGQLNAEREAGVKRQQASSVGAINVTPTNGR